MYGAKLKVWQVFVAGAIWVALGIILGIVVNVSRPDPLDGLGPRAFLIGGLTQIIYAARIWCSAPILVGLYHWYRGLQAYEAHRHELAASAPEVIEVAPPRPSRPIVREAMPNIEVDPFRAPPQPAPLVVVRPSSQPSIVPIVSGDDDHKPRFLA